MGSSFLVDTNIFLEILLQQEKAAEAIELLQPSDDRLLFTTDFSLHTIGLKLLARKQHGVFRSFLKEVIVAGLVTAHQVAEADLGLVADHAEAQELDFDDAYQYTVAERHGLTIVSYDPDFDRTTRGRKTPAEVLRPFEPSG